MNVRNCRKCGKVFNYVSGPFFCLACREDLDKKFKEVKEYVSEHKGASINDVAEKCDVEVSQIHQWLREERLELVEGSGIVLHCETCGTVIYCGRYCLKCKQDLMRGFTRSIASSRAQLQQPEKPKTPRDKDKMRYL